MIYNFYTNIVPDQTIPVIYPVRNQNWVSFGEQNDYPQFLTELYNKSSINRTCINSTAMAVSGEGLKTEDPNLEYVLNRANDEEGWNDLWYKLVLDNTIYGGFALQVIWNKAGDAIHSMYHIPFADIRSGDFEEDGKICWYYYSSNWQKWKKHKPIAYHTFDPDRATEYPSQILYYYNYSPGNRYYPLAPYSGSLKDISVDIQTSQFHLSNLENGLAPSLWINFNGGIPDPERQRALYSEIADSFSGVMNSGKFFLTFSNNKEEAPVITPLEAQNDDYYLVLDKRIKESILSGHRITSPLLLGLYHEGGSGLGSNKDEILTAYAHYKATVVNPEVKWLLKAMDRLMFFYGYNTKLYVEPLSIMDSEQDQTAIA